MWRGIEERAELRLCSVRGLRQRHDLCRWTQSRSAANVAGDPFPGSGHGDLPNATGNRVRVSVAEGKFGRVNQACMRALAGPEAAFARMPALWATNRRIAAALFQDVAMIVLRVWSRECSMHASDWGVRR